MYSRASEPSVSYKGTLVIPEIMQAKSVMLHSSLFLEYIPRKLNFPSSVVVSGHIEFL